MGECVINVNCIQPYGWIRYISKIPEFLAFGLLLRMNEKYNSFAEGVISTECTMAIDTFFHVKMHNYVVNFDKVPSECYIFFDKIEQQYDNCT